MLRAMLDVDWATSIQVLSDFWDCGVTATGLAAAFAQAYSTALNAPDPYSWVVMAGGGFTYGLWEYVEPDTAGECAIAVWESYKR